MTRSSLDDLYGRLTVPAHEHPGLDELSYRHRRIVELRHDGKSWAEIGRVFGVSSQRAREVYGSALLNLVRTEGRQQEAEVEEDALPQDPSIRTLPLGVRSHNALMRAGIDTVGKLLVQTDEDLLARRGLGSGCLADIRRALRLAGY